MESLWKLSACEVVAQLRSGQISIQDTLDSLLTRIKTANPPINALPTLCFERAKDRAAKLQAMPTAERGILCGLPVTIKDLTNVSKVLTTHGSVVYDDHVPAQSDQLVTRIEDRGGIVYAKSNTPEFGTGGITFNDVFGITRTPHNLQFASGGSSGGAAASLASGCAWLSHGSDMAGSLRTPAAFCGVASLRPSPGTIRSNSDYLPFDVLGAEGPMARNISDLALFADVMRNAGGDSLQRSAALPLKPGRVAVSDDLGVAQSSAEVSGAFRRLVDQLMQHQWRIDESQPDLSGVHNAFDVLRAQSYAVGLEDTLAEHPGVMKPEVEWNIRYGIALDAEALRQAQREQGQIINRAANFMEDYDVLICPATSVACVPAELRYPGFDNGVPIPEYYRWLAIAYATTMTTLPVITVPCGQFDNGVPFGIQLIGKPWGELKLFRIARMLEQIIGRNNRPIDPQ